MNQLSRNGKKLLIRTKNKNTWKYYTEKTNQTKIFKLMSEKFPN